MKNPNKFEPAFYSSTCQTDVLTAFESLVVGLVLMVSLGWRNPGIAIPLVGDFADVATGFVLPFFSVILTVLTFFGKRGLSTILFLGFICQVLDFIYLYSQVQAFQHAVFYLSFYAILVIKLERNQRRLASVLVLASFFFFAALQKINANYLELAEFRAGGAFVAFYEFWFPQLFVRFSVEKFKYLPHLSILIELILAVGIFFKPRLFAAAMACFLLILALVNPPVIFVFFYFLPLFMLVDDELFEFLSVLRFKSKITSPYFWLVILILALPKIESAYFFSQLHFRLLFGYYGSIILNCVLGAGSGVKDLFSV